MIVLGFIGGLVLGYVLFAETAVEKTSKARVDHPEKDKNGRWLLTD